MRAAEVIAEDFSRRDSQRDILTRPTLTTVIVPCQAGEGPSQLLEAGRERLTLARQSGKDGVIDIGECEKEYGQWQNEMRTGNPFASVIAQDIMEPFPAVLVCDSPDPATVEALRRVKAPVCPIVDAAGRLVGVASAADRRDSTIDAVMPVSSALPISKPETIDHIASFTEIYEAFSTRGCSTLVVVANQRPLGYLEVNNFLSLIEPINANAFSGVSQALQDSLSLVVRSINNEVEAV
jgi:hypothetical protein